MTKERQQQVLLAVLFAILVIVGGRFLLRALGGGTADGIATARGASGADLSVAGVEALRVAELELEPETYQLGRDPFRFASSRRKPRSRPKPPAVREPRPTPAPTPPPRQQGPPVPRPPAVDVVYLGRFGSSNRPIAVFSDGSEIFNVFEGGVLKGNFVVDKIGYESADLKFVGFPDTPSHRLAVGG